MPDSFGVAPLTYSALSALGVKIEMHSEEAVLASFFDLRHIYPLLSFALIIYYILTYYKRFDKIDRVFLFLCKNVISDVRRLRCCEYKSAPQISFTRYCGAFYQF